MISMRFYSLLPLHFCKYIFFLVIVVVIVVVIVEEVEFQRFLYLKYIPVKYTFC